MRKVFALFVGQATELMGQLESVIRTGDTKQWRHVTHTVKGAARGIGGICAGDAAASAEPIDPALDAESAAGPCARQRTGRRRKALYRSLSGH